MSQCFSYNPLVLATLHLGLKPSPTQRKHNSVFVFSTVTESQETKTNTLERLRHFFTSPFHQGGAGWAVEGRRGGGGGRKKLASTPSYSMLKAGRLRSPSTGRSVGSAVGFDIPEEVFSENM